VKVLSVVIFAEEAPVRQERARDIGGQRHTYQNNKLPHSETMGDIGTF